MKYKNTGLIKQVEGKEVSTEILADSIVRLSTAAVKLQKSGLNRNALLILIQHACGSNLSDGRTKLKGAKITQKQIARILDVLPILKELYTTK